MADKAGKLQQQSTIADMLHDRVQRSVGADTRLHIHTGGTQLA